MEAMGVIVLGIYTVAFVLVFVYQKNLLDKLKFFIEIFDMKKVKEYAEMSSELAQMKALKLIQNDATIIELTNKVFEENADKIGEVCTKYIRKEYLELFNFTVLFLKKIPEELRMEMLDKMMPTVKEKLQKYI
jgi:hypothetical protein